MRMTPKTTNLIQLNIAVLLWGGTAMFAKGIDLPVTAIICLRSLIAAAVLAAVLLIRRSPLRMRRPSHYGVMALLGTLLAAHWLTYFQALKISTAAVAILALHTYPVLTALVEPLVFGEKFKRVDIAVAAAVGAGVAIMTPELRLSNDVTMGVALGVVSGLFFMTRNLLTRKYVQEYTSTALMFWQTLISGGVLVWCLADVAADAGAGATGGLLLLLGVVFTALPQTLFSASFKNLSAKTVGVLATLLPFYGAFWGYLLFDERVTVRTALGGALILACVIFETLRSVRAD